MYATTYAKAKDAADAVSQLKGADAVSYTHLRAHETS